VSAVADNVAIYDSSPEVGGWGVVAGTSIEVLGHYGAVVGGKVFARRSLIARQLGSHGAIATTIAVGVAPERFDRRQVVQHGSVGGGLHHRLDDDRADLIAVAPHRLGEFGDRHAIWQALPLEARGSAWGDEIYFSIPVACEPEAPREVVEMGDLGYWPPGSAFFHAAAGPHGSLYLPASSTVCALARQGLRRRSPAVCCPRPVPVRRAPDPRL